MQAIQETPTFIQQAFIITMYIRTLMKEVRCMTQLLQVLILDSNTSLFDRLNVLRIIT